VNEHILAAVVRLNETKTLGAVEPLYGAGIHNDFLSIVVSCQPFKFKGRG
jgi:hypothetical protein